MKPLLFLKEPTEISQNFRGTVATRASGSHPRAKPHVTLGGLTARAGGPSTSAQASLFLKPWAEGGAHPVMRKPGSREAPGLVQLRTAAKRRGWDLTQGPQSISGGFRGRSPHGFVRLCCVSKVVPLFLPNPISFGVPWSCSSKRLWGVVCPCSGQATPEHLGMHRMGGSQIHAEQKRPPPKGCFLDSSIYTKF